MIKNDVDFSELRNALINAREADGLTQKQVADETGISHFSEYETGRKSLEGMQFQTLWTWCNYLGVSLDRATGIKVKNRNKKTPEEIATAWIDWLLEDECLRKVIFAYKQVPDNMWNGSARKTVENRMGVLYQVIKSEQNETLVYNYIDTYFEQKHLARYGIEATAFGAFKECYEKDYGLGEYAY